MPFGNGPADHHDLLAVQAFDFQPKAAIAGAPRCIDALRDDPLHFHGAGMIVEGLPSADSGDRYRRGESMSDSSA